VAFLAAAVERNQLVAALEAQDVTEVMGFILVER
jgi:hypothetical protein